MASPDPTVELQPLGSGRRGIGPRLAALAVLGLGLGVVGVALLGGDPRPGRAAPTDAAAVASRPASSSTAAVASPTPERAALPTLQLGAADAGDGRLLIGTEAGYGLLDRSSGTVEPIGPFEGNLVAIQGGGWLCLCSDNPWSPDVERLTVRLTRIGADGLASEPILERIIVGSRSGPEGGDAVGVDVAVSDDGGTAVLAWVARQPDGSSRLELETIALARGGRTTTALVAELPADPAVQSVVGPLLELGPGGRSIVVGAWSVGGPDPSTISTPRWVVDLDEPGEPGVAAGRPLDEAATSTDCLSEGWAGPNLYALVCRPTGSWPLTGMQMARWTVAGAALDPIDLDAVLGDDLPILSPLIDSASGRVWLWDGLAHRLVRIDAESGQVDVGPRGGGPPDWPAGVDPYELMVPSLGSPRALVGLDATRRVYAIGEGVEPGASPLTAPRVRSTGIWVFDADSLRLVDHWPATARFVEIVASPDGREILATGIPEVDADGFSRPTQEASITAYDALTGEVRLIAGQLGGWAGQP
jgi:hypothetical protein